MKKRKTPDEVTEHLLKTDSNFRRLYHRVAERNGGVVPSSEEIRRRLEERVAQRRESS
jgi:hypothetical protein